LDYLGLPSVNQPYEIPIEFGERVNDYHDRAIFSIWAHFVSYCYKINHDKSSSPDHWDQSSYVDSPYSKTSLVSPSKNDMDNDDPTSMKNKHVRGAKRLRTFVALSSSQNNSVQQSYMSCNTSNQDFFSPGACRREPFFQNYEEPLLLYSDQDDYCFEYPYIDYDEMAAADDCNWNCYDINV
jgi:hypothetical protein